MISCTRTAGLALVVLGHAVRWAAGVDVNTCTALVEEISLVTTNKPTTMTLTADLVCTETVGILAVQDITVDGEEYKITIASGFSDASSLGASLFSNLGTLTINSLDVVEDEETQTTDPAVRAIYNEGTLTVKDSKFIGLNLRDSEEDNVHLERGGVIYSNTLDRTLHIEGSTFTSNLGSEFGGAICALGTGKLTIVDSDFSGNEVSADSGKDTGRGGDVYAERGLELSVESSRFTGSSADMAGASIWCCGATLTDSSFTSLETSLNTGNYGGVTSGLPGEATCPFDLFIENCNFTRCDAYTVGGKGGALAIFDTTTEIFGTMIVDSQGTAIVFESTSATSPHQLKLNNVELYQNTDGAEDFMYDTRTLGSAMVVTNTGLEEGDESITMGTFNNLFCFGNIPWECEVMYNMANVKHSGEQKCNVCNAEGVKQDIVLDDSDGLGVTDRSVDTDSSDQNQNVIIGLSFALGLTLVVIGALAVYKFRVRKNARRLMEDMGDGDL